MTEPYGQQSTVKQPPEMGYLCPKGNRVLTVMYKKSFDFDSPIYGVIHK